jgi:chaperone modulatory protein CbpM
MAKRDSLELQLLDDATQVSLAELVSASGLALEQLVELIEYGVFEPVNRAPMDQPVKNRAARTAQDRPAIEWRVTSHSLYVARRAARLQRDFELDAGSIALTLSLLERIDELERELHNLRCHLPR